MPDDHLLQPAAVTLRRRREVTTTSPPEPQYTLHAQGGDVPINVWNIKDLLSDLGQRFGRGEFKEEASARRWIPVSNRGGSLVGRVDTRASSLRDCVADLPSGGVLEPFGKDVPPYRLHSREGDVTAAAWTAHEFAVALRHLLEEGKLAKEACLGCWGRVTQGEHLVGHVDVPNGEFVLAGERRQVTYWVRHARGTLPLFASTADELREESAELRLSGALLHMVKGAASLAVEAFGGGALGRIATNDGAFTVAPPAAEPYVVRRKHQMQLWLQDIAGTDDLRREVARRLAEGEFQIEEDLGLRWLPITQEGELVGHLDPAARTFHLVEQRRPAFYRVGEVGEDVAMAAQNMEELRAELAERLGDIERLFGYSELPLTCRGQYIGKTHPTFGILRSSPKKAAPDGSACRTCRYWRVLEESAVVGDTDQPERIRREGQCRRSFPHPKGGRYPRSLWPQTSEDDWCGEWKSGSTTVDH